jgi:hypothetical protein
MISCDMHEASRLDLVHYVSHSVGDEILNDEAGPDEASPTLQALGAIRIVYLNLFIKFSRALSLSLSLLKKKKKKTPKR